MAVISVKCVGILLNILGFCLCILKKHWPFLVCSCSLGVATECPENGWNSLFVSCQDVVRDVWIMSSRFSMSEIHQSSVSGKARLDVLSKIFLMALQLRERFHKLWLSRVCHLSLGYNVSTRPVAWRTPFLQSALISSCSTVNVKESPGATWDGIINAWSTAISHRYCNMAYVF